MEDSDTCVHLSTTQTELDWPTSTHSCSSLASPDAALTHYRQLCSSLQSQLSAAEEDIKDFTESSKELQNELEQELERMEKAEKGMRRELEMVQGDREEWKVSLTYATLRRI